MRILKVLVYSNAFVALVLALLSLSTYYIVEGLPFKWYVPLSIYLGSLVLYSFHRLYKIDFIPKNQLAERHLWVVRNANIMKLVMSFSVLVFMVLLPNYNHETIIWLIPAAIFSLAYTIPLIPAKNGWNRLRDIPFIKPLIISIVVTYLTLCYPIFEAWGIESILDPGLIGLFGERMLFILAVTIPFELRDIVNDKDAGLETVGTELGFNASKRLCGVVVSVWAISFAINALFRNYSIEYMLLQAGLCAILIGGLFRLNPNWKNLSYTLVFEGLIAGYSAAIIVSAYLH